MNFIDRIVDYLSPTAGLKRARHRAAAQILNSYEGASQSRRTEGWRTVSSDANSETRASLAVLRARSHDLVRNNPYASKAISVIANNVVGIGILPQAKARTKARTKVIEDLAKAHLGTKAIDARGLMNFYGLQGQIIRTVAESGECLIRRRRRRTSDGFPLPFQIQVLEPDFLDSSKDGPLKNNGGVVKQGVQFNPVGKRTGYWLFTQHPGDKFSFRAPESRFVPAEDIIHVYRPDRPGQVRGVPWGAPVIIKLRDFDEYDDYQLLRQKIAACYTVFVYDDELGLGQKTPTQDASSNPLIDRIEPGLIEALPAGKRVEFANPPGVTGFGEYSSIQLHAVATGFGVTYESLTGDMSQVNFASGRMGWLEFQRSIDCWRWQMFIPQACQGIWDWFMEAVTINGFGDQPVSVIWSPPRRQMINPEKEVPAIRDAVRSGQMTVSSMIREVVGRDATEFMDEYAADMQALDDRRIVLDSDPRNVNRAGAAQPAAPPDPLNP